MVGPAWGRMKPPAGRYRNTARDGAASDGNSAKEERGIRFPLITAGWLRWPEMDGFQVAGS